MPRKYVPEAGDIVWLNFTPQAGHEQAGHRPALVLSPRAYNEKTNLMVCCPMTTQIKNYPFEVQICEYDARKCRARRSDKESRLACSKGYA